MLVKSMAGKTIMWRGRVPPRMIQAPRGARYLEITLKGLRFTEKWYPVEHVPSHIARIYQLLLKLIRVRGVMAVSLAKRRGYGEKVRDQALSTGCVEIMGSGVQQRCLSVVHVPQHRRHRRPRF